MVRKHEVDGDELILMTRVSTLSPAESEPMWRADAVGFVSVHEADVERVFAEERANPVDIRRANKRA